MAPINGWICRITTNWVLFLLIRLQYPVKGYVNPILMKS